MANTKILVTGGTGTIGTKVVAHLVKQSGVDVSVGVRDTGKAKLGAGVTAVDFDWADPAKVAAAVKGVDAIFLLTPFVDVAVDYTRALVEAAKHAGVKKIVKLSAAGAQQEAFPLSKWHRDAERLVEASGLAWVVLRPNFFMTNLIGYYPPDAEGAIYLPTGAGKAAWVDPDDVAEVAALALTKSTWDGQALDVTGSEALSLGDIAAVLTPIAGRTIKHVDVPKEAARQAMAGMQMPGWMVDGMMDLNHVIENCWAAGTTTVVADITGHAPRTFAEFARANAAAFQKK